MNSRDLLAAERLADRLERAITSQAGAMSATLAQISERAAPLATELRGMLAGGKRLRAAFAYWSFRAHGGDASSDAVIDLGVSLELFQAAALFHDDVIDNSATRRGRPTAHVAFSSLHDDSGWQGDPVDFGRASAILLGDLALIAAQQAFDRTVAAATPAARADLLRRDFLAMQSEVTAGQYLDMVAGAQPPGTPGEDDLIRTVLVAKSARYSVEYPLALGAELAGATDADIARIRAFGLPVGQAFQLRDDLIGVFGDPAATGKPAGDDLREGKRTLLASWALAGLGEPQREGLLAVLGDRAASATQIDTATALIASSGAPERIEREIGSLIGDATPHLAGLADPGAAHLAALAAAATDRAR